MLRGIYELHKKGIIHWDLKHENLLVSYSDYVINDYNKTQIY